MGEITGPIVSTPSSDAIEVVLTLDPAQYDDFTRDLEELREKTGAASNTQAVVKAVQRLAAE